jgi:hypothetical protein
MIENENLSLYQRRLNLLDEKIKFSENAEKQGEIGAVALLVMLFCGVLFVAYLSCLKW